jgi:hypothetical protein
MGFEVLLDSGSNCTFMTQSNIEIKSSDFKYGMYCDWDVSDVLAVCLDIYYVLIPVFEFATNTVLYHDIFYMLGIVL